MEANIRATGTLGRANVYAKHQKNIKKKTKKKPKKPAEGAEEGAQPDSAPAAPVNNEDENFYDLDDDFIDDTGVQDEIITEDYLMAQSSPSSSLHSQIGLENEEQKEEEDEEEDEAEIRNQREIKRMKEFYSLFVAYSHSEVKRMLQLDAEHKQMLANPSVPV